MSDDQILIEVARLDGIELVENSTMGGWRWVASNCRSEWYASKEDALKNPPDDYLNSRDAIISAIEKVFTGRLGYYERGFISSLQEVLGFDCDTGMMDKREACALMLATPRQLAIALLKSVGKFRE